MQKTLAEETNLCQEPLIRQLDLHCPDNNKQSVSETQDFNIESDDIEKTI